jgi:hypothetical protein
MTRIPIKAPATLPISHDRSRDDAPPGRKYPVSEAAAYIGVSKSLLNKKRLTGDGPVYIKVGRRVLYDLTDLENWIASSKRRNTSERV